jgi:mannose-1-phosphate guanylyltransferase
MLTFITNEPQNCGICDIDQGILVGFKEKDPNTKGKIANAAVYIFEPEVIEWIDKNENVLDISTQVISNFLGKISVQEHHGFFRDIGNIQSLIDAQTDVSNLETMIEDEWQSRFIQSELFSLIENKKLCKQF